MRFLRFQDLNSVGYPARQRLRIAKVAGLTPIWFFPDEVVVVELDDLRWPPDAAGGCLSCRVRNSKRRATGRAANSASG